MIDVPPLVLLGLMAALVAVPVLLRRRRAHTPDGLWVVARTALSKQAVLAALEPGHVIRLDHPVDRPADLVVVDRRLGTAHLGKRRRRVAVPVVTPPTPAASAPPARRRADGTATSASGNDAPEGRPDE